MNGSQHVVISHAGQRIHSLRGLAQSVFAWGKRNVPSQLFLLVLRPLEFELSALISDPQYQPLANEYIAAGHKNNLWLRRTPFSPCIKAVRFSDFTPLPLLHKSNFYQDILSQAQIEYGAAVSVWKKHTWLASLRFLRTREQGDYTNNEMHSIQHWQPSFAQAVTRLAQYQEDLLTRRSLENFIHSLPLAFAVLNWDLNVQFHNSAAIQVCHWWRHGSKTLFLKMPTTFLLPDDILVAVRQMQAEIQQGMIGQSSSCKTLLSPHADPSQNLCVLINYESSKSLTLSRGFFHLYWRQEMAPDFHNGIHTKLNRLTSRERDCVKLLSSGKAPPQIARMLGTSRNTVRNQLSSIYQKLGVSGQVELVAFFARHPEIISGSTHSK